MATGRSPSVCGKVCQTPWGAQRFACSAYLIRSWPTHIGSATACPVSYGRPSPPLVPLAAHKAPPCIDLGFLSLPDDDVKLRRITTLQETFVDLCDHGLFFSTAAN